MITNAEDIKKNKDTIIELINSVEREGFKKDELITKLVASDFFTAPASTKFHNAFEGGLADHTLNVYYNLKSLVTNKHLEEYISADSIILVSIFHDISKMNFYESEIKNKKIYSDDGSKHDSGGYYDWVQVNGFRIRDIDNRLVFGSHESTSEFIARQYCPLTIEESAAILHHMGGKGWDSAQDDITGVFNNYPLAVLLHVADTISSYIDETV